MLQEGFGGRFPSHFKKTDTIKAIITAESVMWSANNFITPIFGIFVATNIKGGSIEIAGIAYSIYLVCRVIATLASGEYLSKSSEWKKSVTYLIGVTIVSIGYIGFAISKTVFDVYLFYGLVGIALGIDSPAKNALFSDNVDREKGTFEYGILDASVFICEALAAALGGFIASTFGFKALFYIASFINFLSVGIYFLQVHNKKQILKSLR